MVHQGKDYTIGKLGIIGFLNILTVDIYKYLLFPFPILLVQL